MVTFGKKKFVHMLYTTPVLVGMSICVVVLLLAVWQRYEVERRLHSQRLLIQSEEQAALEQRAALQAQVEYMEGEHGVEEEIRKHFDVAREGEQVVILIGDPAVSTVATTTPAPPKKPWYQFWR